MSQNCRVAYIDKNYKTVDPKLADRLTDIYHEIWKEITSSKLFREYKGEGGRTTYLFSKVGTQQNKEQIKLIRSINERFNQSNNKSLIDSKDTASGYNKKVLVDIRGIAQQEYNKIIASTGIQGTLFQKTGGTVSSRASEETISTIKDFLKRIGVKIESLEQIAVNGIKQDANGAALIMQQLVQVVNGKEDVALTEEAMHFAVEIMEQTNPALFNKMLKEINTYNILTQVIDEYGNVKAYQTPDGKPDIRKLKKEAIAKVLTETIIQRAEGFTEKPELLSRTLTWWESIIEALKSLFGKSGFDQAAMNVLSGEAIGTVEDIRAQENDIYLQEDKPIQQRIVENVKGTTSRIVKLPDSGGYETLTGSKIRRVSDIAKTWYENLFADKDLLKSEFAQAVNDLKAEQGTDKHKYIEVMLDEHFLDAEGKFIKNKEDRPDDSAFVSKLSNIDAQIYDALKKNLEQRLMSFPDETIFLTEQIVYDPERNLAGTIDFMAVTKEGKVNILDWKFVDINVDNYEDIPWYKVGAWKKQMSNYKSILQNAYGVEFKGDEQTRMIPIRAKYTKGNAKENVKPQLEGIEIGNVDVKLEERAYLLPVGAGIEKTGNAKIDALLVKLNNVYDIISAKKVTPEQKKSKAEELNKLYTAIRQLQVRQNIKPLIIQAKILNREIENIILDYETNWKDQDVSKFTRKQKNDFANRIMSYEKSLSVYTSLSTDLKALFRGELSEEDEKVWKDIRETTETANELESDLNDVKEAFASEVIAKSKGVLDFLVPEKVIKGFSKWFGSTSTLQSKASELLYKMADEAFSYASMDTVTQGNILLDIKERYDKWAKGKGLNNKNYFDIIKKKNKNELIDEFDPKFYQELKDKTSKDGKDIQWIRENIDIPAYNAYLKEFKESEKQRIERDTVGIDEQDRLNQVARLLAENEALHDTSTTESPGWLLYNQIKKFPNRSKWESAEWKELNKKGNEPAKEFYDYIIDRNKYFESIKYINAKSTRVFLPFVRKSLMEKIVMGGKLSVGEGLLRSITVSEGDVGYGEIDPITKQPVYTIPKYFTRDTDEEVSGDLFRNMTLLNDMAIRYEYLSDIEEQMNLIVSVEGNKEAIKTSYFGRTKYKDDGTPETTSDNSENTQLVRDMMEAIVYGHKYVESENFDMLLGGLGNFGKKANEKLGRKIFPEEFDNTQISLNKSITQLNNFFQIKTLGLNPISALSNFLGGSFQSMINAGTYFTKTQFLANEFLVAGKLRGADAKKYLGALEYFLPLTENYNVELAKKLSLSKLSQEGVQEFMMSLMRNSDQYVQTVNFFSFLENTIVQDGEVINAREYLRKTPEYANIYNVSGEQRKVLEKKFEDDVAALVKEKGVLNIAEVQGDEFVIPGVERKSDSVISLRRKVQSITKDALGNLSEGDIRKINLNIYGKSFMIFKNWIPRLVDVRFGDIKYNSAKEAYEWGRTRMMANLIFGDFTNSIDSLKSAIAGNDEVWVAQMKKLYEAKRASYKKETGKELRMTEAEFIDLVRLNVKNQITDVLFYLILTSLFLLAKSFADDDDDLAAKNRHKFMLRVLDKVRDEVAYFYNPTSILSLTSSGVFPSLGYLDNVKKIVGNFGKEMYAIGIGDQEMQDKNFVIKYSLKGLPITSQFDSILLLFFPDVAKDLGMRAQGEAKPFGK